MMPTEIHSLADAPVRRPGRWQMVIGSNAPFALWTAYAVARPFTTGASGLWCPTHAILGWCPTCGMTGEYSDLLYNGRVPGWWTIIIIAAFIAVAGASMYRVLKP